MSYLPSEDLDVSKLRYDRISGRGNPVKRTDGKLIVGDISHEIPISLLDTGCDHSSFIHPSFADRCNLVRHQLPDPYKIRVADKRVLEVTEYVEAAISFPHKGDQVMATLKLYVFDSGLDIIIGLRDILKHYVEFLIVQLWYASPHSDIKDIADVISIMKLFHDRQSPGESLIDPFDSIMMDAPELNVADYELLRTNEDMLNYLSEPYEEAVAKLLASIPEHVPLPEIAERPLFQELRNGKWNHVFLPVDRNSNPHWHGIYVTASTLLQPDGLNIETFDSIPPYVDCRQFHCPPKLLDKFLVEWKRLCTYMYVKHDTGSYASPLVIADKKTPPYIRVAVDLRQMNQWIKKVQMNLPNPIHIIHKLLHFKYIGDFDITNGFHGIPLNARTSSLLAALAHDGLYRPKFLPEGVGPASGIFQAIMQDIFKDYRDWCHIIIDNIIIGADTPEDFEEKTRLIFKRCEESGLTLKMSKSWFGVKKANFFGYELNVETNTYGMDDKRVQAIKDIPFPTSTKEMQHFLGATIFFRHHVEEHGTVMAPLHVATEKDFDWKNTEAIAKLKVDFETAKNACANSILLFQPNYDWDWIFRPDASNLGVGGILLQKDPSTQLLQPIAVVSKKFSKEAANWKTIEQEGYAIFYGVLELRYLLTGKSFIVETDHANLQWMSKSTVAKLIRWRLTLQDFDFLVRHIPGTKQQESMADYLSRAHVPDTDTTDTTVHCLNILSCLDTVPDPSKLCQIIDEPYDDELDILNDYLHNEHSPFSAPAEFYAMDPDEIQMAFDLVHNCRIGHYGAKRTWYLFNEYFPGHSVKFSTIRNMVHDCPVCAKERATGNQSLEQPTSNLETFNWPTRGWCGCDTVTLPMTKSGLNKMMVFVEFNTKLTRLYPIKNEDDITVARTIFEHTARNGRYRGYATDPGSSFKSKVVEDLLNKWLRVKHIFSLVDRHESNGAEGRIKLVIHFLKTLCNAEGGRELWDQPEFYLACEAALNDYADYETGISPNQAVYGELQSVYMGLPDTITTPDQLDGYLYNLNNCLTTIRTEMDAYHKELIEQRKRKDLTVHNTYQPGDFVLFIRNPRNMAHKFMKNGKGPYEVLSTNRGTYKCRHLGNKKEYILHGSRLEIYPDTDLEIATALANQDDDNFQVDSVIGYRGDPVSARKYTSFLFKFKDGDLVWNKYNPDILNNEQWMSYVKSRPELEILLKSAREAGTYIAKLRKENIDPMTYKPSFYLNLRALGFLYYHNIDLPDYETTDYVILANFDGYSGKVAGGHATRADIHIPLINKTLTNLDKYWFQAYAQQDTLKDEDILITQQLIQQYPKILDTAEWRLDILQRPEAPLVGTQRQRQGGRFYAPRRMSSRINPT